MSHRDHILLREPNKRRIGKAIMLCATKQIHTLCVMGTSDSGDQRRNSLSKFCLSWNLNAAQDVTDEEKQEQSVQGDGITTKKLLLQEEQVGLYRTIRYPYSWRFQWKGHKVWHTPAVLRRVSFYAGPFWPLSIVWALFMY